MTSFAFVAAHGRARLGRIPLYAALALAIVAAAILWQMSIGLWGDVTWLLMLDERWFAGERPYIDFLEINPPASLLVYAPEVIVAKALGVASETVVVYAGFALAALSLALSGAILKRAGRLGEIGPVGFAVALFVAFFLPGDAFMERDVMAAALLTPYLALAFARAEHAPVERWQAVAAGLGVGLAIALKPPYGLAAVAPAAYALWRNPRSLVRSVEVVAAAAVVLAYGVVALVAFPAYAANMGPALVNVYLAVRQSAFELAFSEGGRDFLCLALLGAYLAHDELTAPRLAIPGLAAVGAFVGYVAQGKGWLYQAYPAIAFAALFAALALERAAPRRLDRALSVFALIAALALGAFISRWGVAIAIAASAAAALRHAWSPGALGPALARFAAAATLGAAAAAFMPGPQPSEALGRALAKLKPHPTVMAISESFDYVHPMVRRVGAQWVGSTPNMVIASGARLLMDEHSRDAALKAKLEPYVDRDIARLVQDIDEKRPDAIIVGPLNTRFHAGVWSDPRVAAAMRDYTRVAANDLPDHPGELWARKAPIGLRPGF